MAAVEMEQSLLCDHQGIAGLRPAAERNPKRVRSEFQLSDFKADSCVTFDGNACTEYEEESAV
jgi:hypothetical protein